MLKTHQAIELLSQSQSFQAAKPYLGCVQEAERSGMRAAKPIPTYEVGSRTWNADLNWYASTIAHDAYHSFLKHTDQPWIGTEAEKLCLKFQAQVMDEIGGEKERERIGRILEKAKNPTYHLVAERDW